MGMSASQARFLCLTARKNNVEFEGQQINQQRTTLSNESASYYSELCNMAVPVPPSIDDFTKVSYTFNDGAMTNTVTSLIYSKGENGNEAGYHVNYVQQWQDDYSIVPASTSLVQVEGDKYTIGATVLRKIGDTSINGTTPSANQGNTGNTGGTSGTRTPEETPEEQNNSSVKEYIDITDSATGQTTRYEVFRDSETNQPYYEKPSSALSEYEENMLMYFDTDASGNVTNAYIKGSDNKYYHIDDIGQDYPISGFNEEAHTMATEDESGNTYLVGIENGQHIKLDDDGNSLTGGRVDITDESQIIKVNEKANPAAGAQEAENENAGVTAQNIQETESNMSAADYSKDEYLSTLSGKDLENALAVESYYLALLRDSVDKNANFYIRYVKNTTTGNYEPFFYKEGELTAANTTTDRNLKSVAAYTLGTETKTKEVLNQKCSIEQDASGRYVAITVEIENNGKTEEKKYTLNTSTTTDEDAYNDAMNLYYYKQHEYDHKIQEINSKLEIIQQQDKQLELKLKQLDTEENAISTEMDAVKKVISKNVDSSFKTFNA